MCASWRIGRDDARDEVTVTMLLRDEIAISQDGAEIVVSSGQLSELADKLYFLDQAFRADARDVVEALCSPAK
ncbi:hypothetical protein GCM10025787_33790 [Saccharopolyspora rosea]|uniref:DUF5753 domain-containing protein n=1 Tax=Saccharopolyspora rosea TaxID=524884 RepID=A0ABW3FUL7_9PSEU